MADQLFYTGFEGGARDQLASLANLLFVDDGFSRTGQFSAYANVITPAGAAGYGIADVPTPGQAIADGNYTTARQRIYFQLQALPSLSNVNIFGYGVQPANFAANLVINTAGNVAAALTTIGAFSAFALVPWTAQNQRWYRAELALTLTNPTVGNTTGSVVIDIYDGETNILIGTVSHNVAYGVLVPSVLAPNFGHTDAIVSSYIVKFDDWVSRVEDNGSATLPLATRITRIDNTGQFQTIGFTGDWKTTINIPRETATVDEQTTVATIGRTIFLHESAEDLLLEGIEALTVYAQVKETALTADTTTIRIGTTDYVIALSNAYPTRPFVAQRWLPLNNSDFTNLKWGVVVIIANSVQVAQVYAEVLHEGKDIFAQRLLGIDGFKVKCGSYVGNGSYQTIVVGFRPQVIIVKKMTGVASAGIMKLGCHGGTISKPFIGAVTVLGITGLTDTGFNVASSTHCNETGIVYEYVAMQDGGFDQDCKRLRIGQYVGDGLDNRNIIIPCPAIGWNAVTFVMIWDFNAAIWRTTIEVGDVSQKLDASAGVSNMIQSITAGLFQVGTSPNGLNNIVPYIAIQAAGILNLFEYDSLVAVGGADVISGLTFQPAFVIGKRIAAIDAQWRSIDHAALASSEWNAVTQNNLGIVSLNVDGFTLGTNLSVAGQTTKWIAFIADGELVYTIPTLDAGPDQIVNAFTTVNFAPIITTDYPCSALSTTYLWEQISGPIGGSLINSPDIATGGGVDFTASGVYVFQLTIDDGISIVTDTVQITVTNAAPIVSITTLDQIIALADGGLVNLLGTALDDGFPVPPGVLTLLWSVTSGPASVVFGTPTALGTTATFSVAGIYVIRFSGFDGELTTFDEITITVLADCTTPGPDPILPIC